MLSQCRSRANGALRWRGRWSLCTLLCLLGGLSPLARASATKVPAPTSAVAAAQVSSNKNFSTLQAWTGHPVAELRFTGVTAQELAPLPTQLALRVGQPFTASDLRESIRKLFATGLYEQITAQGIVQGNAVVIVFQGTPQVFLHRIYVEGIHHDLFAAQLQRATRLEIGTKFTHQSLQRATESLRATLRQSGYFQPQIDATTRPGAGKNQIDVVCRIVLGRQAHVGAIDVTGNPDMTLQKFRKVAKLKAGSKVQTETLSRALQRLQKKYQKQNRLEATVKGNEKQFDAKNDTVEYTFSVDRGPLVRVHVTGASISSGAIKSLIPVYEEGAVDPDLLNEGDRNLRDHLQRQGYFDAHVSHVLSHPVWGEDLLLYRVVRGSRQKVVSVRVSGNHYFDDATILERLSVVKADLADRYGRFSQSLLERDSNAIQALYKSNGFSQVTVTPLITDAGLPKASGRRVYAGLKVDYQIEEGPQQRVGIVRLLGVEQVAQEKLLQQMNTRPGQPYSASNLAGDRTTILTYYYRHGFLQVEMTITQQEDAKDPNLIDIDCNIQEGKQFFVDQVLTSGIHYTRPQVVSSRVELHSGDPLDRSKLLDTQRRLYNLALFNEVDMAVVNPRGAQQKKDVLLNISEAHRWNYDYGLGFEAQTGTPQTNCPSAASLIQLGQNPATFKCSPNGTFGASERISFDISRINLRGRNQSITLQTAYGNLEKQATMVFDNPAFYGDRKLDFSISGGYVQSQDITTYSSSSISASGTFTHRPDKANTLIYSFAYRYITLDNLQISANLIPLLSQPARVSGPGITWVHDTRDDPLNPTRGWYLSAQQFFAWSGFGAQANFNRLDVTQSNYYRVHQKNWIFARSTRFGIENIYGNPSYGTIPLPERLYAGGATSHRGFSINSAGPRDLQTGYPVGGSGAFINTLELRIPPIALPYVGKNLGWAIFNDMGNVYDTESDIWSGLFRFRQPNRSTCNNISGQNGVCNFNYNSQALGAGPRYKTPIGPIRVDFSYNLNPTVYPVILSYSGRPPYVGNSGRFNFFFSVGQSF